LGTVLKEKTYRLHFAAFVVGGVEKRRLQALDDRHHGIQISRGDGPDHRQHAVALDQLAGHIHGDRRIGPVVGVDHFDGPSEDPARRVDVLGGKIKPELGLPAVKLDAAGERQHRADLDGLGGVRARCVRDRGAADQPEQ
jgi:hypothetical protein